MENTLISPEIEFVLSFAHAQANRELNRHFQFHEYSMKEAPCEICEKSKEAIKFIEKIQNKTNVTYQQMVAEKIRKGS